MIHQRNNSNGAMMNPAHGIWFAAMLLALLVHGGLLILFREAPNELPPESGDLPAVNVLDLCATENDELARWMDFHDPALMTATDNNYGYSEFVRSKPLHADEADLPQFPQLAEPRPLTLENGNAVKLAVPETGPLLVAAGYLPLTSAETDDYPRIWVNGRRNKELGEHLRHFMKEAMLPELSAQSGYTQFDVERGRFSELGARLQLRHSCGIAELDQWALLVAGNWIQNHHPDMEGTMVLEWQGNSGPGVAEKGSK